MNRLFRSLLLLLVLVAVARGAEPLRVFIRAGAKTHGPGQHDHPRFLADWTKLLTARGVKAEGGMDWPSAEQWDATDVVIVFAPDPWDVKPEQRAAIEKFAARGGSFVVLHDGVCGHTDPAWVRSLLGGAWRYGKAKYFEGDISMYYVMNSDPIVAGASNFDLRDEMYYDLEMDPAAHVLAATWTPDARGQQKGRAFPNIYAEAPMIWTFENKNSRAYVNLLGHEYATFDLPQVRAVLLRGLAWAGRRANLDEFCAPEELASLRYPAGGPSRPAEEGKKLSLHPEFKATLIASEPLINKPIAIDWDARGRTWIAETVEYPNGRRGMRDDFAGAEWKDHGSLVPQAGLQSRPARDRISILIDSKGDGVADQKQVFYEGLELVTSFCFYKDGVIVAAAPDIWWIRDTDGDGKADKVEKIYTGLGTGDTHAVINNLRWGADGWIYATHGYSATDHLKSGDGTRDFGRIGSGVVRFKPDGSAFEQYSSKGGNTWGLAITSGNDVFWTQPTSGDLFMQTILPESVLARGRVEGTTSFNIITKSGKSYPSMTWEQQAYRQIDFVGSFTAAAGCAIYDGGAWPAKYNHNYFTTEPTINIVHHEVLEPAGVSFTGHRETGREETEFIRSNDLWFRPIEVRVGPDGALYVLDFYNQAVIHNDTRGPVHNKVNAAVRPDRDHYFGRVWRIDHAESQRLAVPDLSKATNAELLAALKSANRAVRFTAQRLLSEAPQAPADAPLNAQLQALASDLQKSAESRCQALWTLHARQAIDDKTMAGALQPGGDDAVAESALRILVEEPRLVAGQMGALLRRARGAKPPVRLAAALAVGAAEDPRAIGPALLSLLPELDDHFMQSAALAAANRAPAEFLQAVLATGGEAPSQAATSLALQVASGLERQPEAAARVIVILAAQPASALAEAVLARLSQGARAESGPVWNSALEQGLHTLLQRDGAEAAAALPLAVAWDRGGSLSGEIKAMLPALLTRLADPAGDPGALSNAASTLLAARALSPEVLPALAKLLGSAAPAAVQQHLIEALGQTSEAATGEMLVAAYPHLAPTLQAAAFAQMLKRPEWTRAFLAGLKSRAMPLDSLGVIALDKLRHHPDAATAKLAAEIIDGLRGPQIQQKDALIASLLPGVEQGGDPAQGKVLFSTTCAICHRFNGEGAQLAPDLTGMGVHSRAELLVDIVDPNREVDPSFAAYDFQTRRGESFQGIIAFENAQTVRVRDAAGEHELRKDELTGRHELGRSLMPEGFEALGAPMLRDILAYLQAGEQRFRILDLRAVFTADSRRGLFQDEANVADTLHFKRFGNVKVGEVPFVIADPVNTKSGYNLLILRGGGGHAKTYPQRVEVAAGKVHADTLNILGGVGGWAFPCCGDEKGEGLPVAKITVLYEGGTSEEIVLQNGVEIADFARPHDVPGSKLAPELVSGQQVRVIRKTLTKPGVIDKLIIESFDNRVAPLFVAITAETATEAKPTVTSR